MLWRLIQLLLALVILIIQYLEVLLGPEASLVAFALFVAAVLPT